MKNEKKVAYVNFSMKVISVSVSNTINDVRFNSFTQREDVHGILKIGELLHKEALVVVYEITLSMPQFYFQLFRIQEFEKIRS